jgi:flagellar biosynthesis protein FlhG
LNLAGSEAESFLSQLSDLASETDDLIIDTGAGMNPNVMAFLEVSDTVLVVSTQDPSSMADAYAITKACCVSRRDADLRLVVNMADSEADANVVHRRFSSVAHQFLGRSIPYAGFVRSDSKAVACTRNRKPFLLGAPNTAASLDTINVARRLIGVSVDSRQGIVGRLRDLLSGEQRMAS